MKRLGGATDFDTKGLMDELENKMSDYQDKLKNADGEEATKDILAAYQRAQGAVDKELDK